MNDLLVTGRDESQGRALGAPRRSNERGIRRELTARARGRVSSRRCTSSIASGVQSFLPPLLVVRRKRADCRARLPRREDGEPSGGCSLELAKWAHLPAILVVGPRGFEPRTCGLRVWCDGAGQSVVGTLS